LLILALAVCFAAGFSLYLVAHPQGPGLPLQAQRDMKLQPVVSPAVRFGETMAARDLPPEAVAERAPGKERQGEKDEKDIRNHLLPRQVRAVENALARRLTPQGDTAVQMDLPAPRMPSPIDSFEGLGRTDNINAGFPNLSPPDTNGDVGPNHYVQQTNLLVRVFTKAGAAQATFKLSSLYQPGNGGPGGQCGADDQGDPIVLYDPLADRWILSQFAFLGDGETPPYHECIAVSKTPDPAGAYFAYDFITPNNEFPDYPKIGVWPDAYYMMVHQFTNGGPFNGTGMYAFDRAKMIVGDATASYIYFNLNSTSHPEFIGGGLPADLDGLTPPPLGAPNIFAYFTAVDFTDPANGIRLFNFHADFANPGNSTFTERSETSYASPLPVAAFSVVTPSGLANVPQPSPASTVSAALDALPDRFLHRMQYRNRGGFETLVLTHTVGAPGSTKFDDGTGGAYRAAPRYYELRSTAGGSYTVQEQATFAPGGAPPGDNINRWMGSAAEDNAGNLAIGYSVSSNNATGIYPGLRYAGRLAGDPAGGLAQGEATLIAGTGVQTSSGHRWGDYSALTLDPVDDCTFWYTNEYYTAAGQAASSVGWQTRIGRFKFAQCSAPQEGPGHFAITACGVGNNVPNALVTIDGRPYGGTVANGTFDATLAPGAHTYSVSAAGYSSASGNFNVSNGNVSNVVQCIQGVPHVVTSGSSLTNETCGTPNGVIDPNEQVNVSFCVLNNGGIGGNTTALVGTLQATGGVLNPSGPQSYGAVVAGGAQVCRTFTLTAGGSCGGTLTATIQFQDGATNLGTIPYVYTLGTELTPLVQNFDGVTVPNLPAGWVATNSAGPAPLWTTSNGGLPAPAADTGSIALYVDDPSVVSDKRIETPAFTYHSGAKLSFRQNFDLEEATSVTAYDAGVLEIQINGGGYQDIIDAGGSFVMGGYNHTGIDNSFSNPLLPSRPNWSGASGGFITTVVNMPPAGVNQPVTLRWRMGSDVSVTHTGWRIDTVKVSDGFNCLTCTAPFTDEPLTAQVVAIKRVHVLELRSRIDAQRVRFGLAAFNWTDPTLTAGVTKVKAVHITEMRTALNQAYVAHGLAAPGYTDPGLAAGNLVKAVHITDLRTAVKNLEIAP